MTGTRLRAADLVCLHCGHTTEHRTRISGVAVLPAHSAPETGPRDCLGSFVPPVSTDEVIDAFRRRALANAQTHRDDAEAKWKTGIRNATGSTSGLRTASFLGAHMPEVVWSEEMCLLWVRTAFCGEYLRPLAEMIAKLAESPTHSGHTAPMHAAWERSAARDWIREMRVSLLREFPDGLSNEQFAGLLGSF